VAGLKSLIKETYALYKESSLLGTLKYIFYKILLKRNMTTIKTIKNTAQKGIGIVGAGQYVATMHLPLIKKLKQNRMGITSASGKTAAVLAYLYDMSVYDSLEDILKSPLCDALLIATPPNQHPKQIVLAVQKDRYTFCEKPVAIDEEGIQFLLSNVSVSDNKKVMVGFNRRFAPAITQLLQEDWLLKRTQPMEIQYRVNYGPSVKNWLSDKEVGGGRIHGAACHYVDLIVFLAKSSINRVSCIALGHEGVFDQNTFSSHFLLEDGSIASLIFTSEGDRDFDTKEEIKITCKGHIVVVDDFKRLQIDGKVYRFLRHSYGALDCMRAFFQAKKDNAPVPVSLQAGVRATQVTLAMQKSLERKGESRDVF
jgi:predicted dehydrogenase